MPKKIYCNDLKTVRKFAEDVGKKLIYLNSNSITGYCECPTSVQVFCKNSYVDQSKEYIDVTGDYVYNYNKFVL